MGVTLRLAQTAAGSNDLASHYTADFPTAIENGNRGDD
jgi:hypothetical protein